MIEFFAAVPPALLAGWLGIKLYEANLRIDYLYDMNRALERREAERS